MRRSLVTGPLTRFLLLALLMMPLQSSAFLSIGDFANQFNHQYLEMLSTLKLQLDKLKDQLESARQSYALIREVKAMMENEDALKDQLRRVEVEFKSSYVDGAKEFLFDGWKDETNYNQKARQSYDKMADAAINTMPTSDGYNQAYIDYQSKVLKQLAQIAQDSIAKTNKAISGNEGQRITAENVAATALILGDIRQNQLQREVEKHKQAQDLIDSNAEFLGGLGKALSHDQ